MSPQELKNAILQLAIQGKLVEQRPEEGMAEVPAAPNTEGREARRKNRMKNEIFYPSTSQKSRGLRASVSSGSTPKGATP